MSSIKTDSTNKGKAETAFREAFERLKRDKPKLLPKGTRVSQNNIAREAGLDPSALKKARFPTLIEEIQRWLQEHGDQLKSAPSRTIYAQRNRNRTLKEQIEALKEQRDMALAQLVDADARILELTMENERLRAQQKTSNVTTLKKRGADPWTK